MVAAISIPKTPSQEQQRDHLRNPTRPPLLPSEKDNAFLPRKPRGRQIPSRYLSPSPSPSPSNSTSTSTSSTSSSSSRRYPSPLLSRSTNLTPAATPASTPLSSSVPKRSQSVDRRRPMTTTTTSRSVTPVPETSAAAKLLVTSTRSLSVSFQGEAFSLPISKTRVTSMPSLSNVRKGGTPERRRATVLRDKSDVGGVHGENSKVIDQHRWPGRNRGAGANLDVNLLSRSLDCSIEEKMGNGIGSGNVVVRTLQQTMQDDSRRASFDGRLSLDLASSELLKPVRRNPDADSVNESSVPSDLTTSDTDSVSSGSTSGVQDCGSVAKGRTGSRGIVVSARFWQETNSRLRRLHDPGSPLSTSLGTRVAVTPSKLSQSKRFSSDGPLASPRSMASPIRGANRPPSPSKLWSSSVSSSPSRGISSPSRTRNGVGGSLVSNSISTPSILSFSVDIRRGKMGEDRIVDAHILRLQHNRYLQWRFVNARADATFMMQRLNAERSVWNAWVTISELRHSVTLKRIKLLLLRQKLKLTSILKGQMSYLEEWALLDRDHSNSLLGATEALKASTLRLPVVGKAIADIQNLKDAVGSAVDVMHAMASSICYLSSKVEETNSVVAELVKVTAKERILLQQCEDFLSTLAAMQVKDCSLRTHILQLNRLPTEQQS